MSRYRYRWKDRHDDLVNRKTPWLLYAEFALLVVLTSLAIGQGVMSLFR
jgi:hypothetical protein